MSSINHLMWAPGALHDIARLRSFISPKNLKAAQRAAKTIKQAANYLLKHPQIGRIVEDMEEEYRDLVVPFGAGSYILRYRIKENVIYIVHVRHSKEDEIE